MYVIWKLYRLLMSFSLNAPRGTCELFHAARVQTEEHNNTKMTKSYVSYHTFPSAGQAALNQEIKWAPKLGACGAGSH